MKSCFQMLKSMEQMKKIIENHIPGRVLENNEGSYDALSYIHKKLMKCGLKVINQLFQKKYSEYLNRRKEKPI